MEICFTLMHYFKSTYDIYEPFEISTIWGPIRYKVGCSQRFRVKKNGYAEQVQGETCTQVTEV